VKALLEKGADVHAENRFKCAFACFLYWTDVDCLWRRRPCGRSTRGECIGAMQGHGAAPRI
jgi:hypothetical protein